MSLESLEQLPDDVLLMVMQCLSVESLFTCRLVCKRLGGLALHPAVWRHRSLSGMGQSEAAVLCLAPCLNEVCVYSRALALQMMTTRCAVASLILELTPDGQERGNATELAFVIRNQEALGRLRSLVFLNNMSVTNETATAAEHVLLRTLAQCSNLVSLKILGDLPQTTHPVGPPRSSLKRFHCNLDDYSQTFVNTLLAGHAATLEKVDLRYGDVDNDTTARLLGAMSNLQKLWCVNMPGMEAVAACSTLRNFSIPMYYELSWAADLVKFLQRASQLKVIELDFKNLDFCPEVSAVLLKGLTTGRQSRVEELCLPCFRDVRPLFSRLRMLPALRRLTVAQAELDDTLLRFITPETTPALRLLDLGTDDDDGVCTHAWLHRAAVKKVLAMNPSLHIKFWGRYECDLQGCEACTGDCHQEVTRKKAWPFGLFSHDANKCPCPEYHTTTDVEAWIHFDSIST